MPALLLFDGLGGPNPSLVPALREQWRQPRHRAFFDTALRAVESTADYVGVPTPPMRNLFLNTTDHPSEIGSVMAGICVHAHQLCHLQPTERPDGAGALGHSLGLQAAIVAGLATRRTDDFLAVVDRSIRLVTLTLLRGHQHMSDRPADSQQTERYFSRSRGTDRPGPMAAVGGLRSGQLQQLVADFGSTVSIGLVNSPKMQVVTGHTADLVEFHQRLEPELTAVRGTFAFLPNTIAFHSDHLRPAVLAMASDRDFLGPPMTGAQLSMPVYSTDTPGNLQQSADLTEEFLKQMMLRPIDWGPAVAYAMASSDADRIIDFGPGPGARVFTRDCLRATGARIRFDPVTRVQSAR